MEWEGNLVDRAVWTHNFAQESCRLQDMYLCIRLIIQFINPEHCVRELVEIKFNVLHEHSLDAINIYREEDPAAWQASAVSFGAAIIRTVPTRPLFGNERSIADLSSSCSVASLVARCCS